MQGLKRTELTKNRKEIIFSDRGYFMQKSDRDELKGRNVRVSKEYEP